MAANDVALVTGATSGIGLEIARQLAERGHDLVIASRKQSVMDDVADEIKRKYGRTVTTVVSDLGKPGSAQKLFDDIQHLRLRVTVLINNSGFGHAGWHWQAEVETVTAMCHLNMTSLAELCTLFGNQMKDRIKADAAEGHGGEEGWILNVASIAAFMPVPLMSVYGATKAFVLSFSEALRKEHQVARTGVNVCALCPGVTETKFFTEADPNKREDATTMYDNAQIMQADDVARQGLDALFSRRARCIPGALNKVLTSLPRLFPRDMVVDIGFKSGKGGVIDND